MGQRAGKYERNLVTIPPFSRHPAVSFLTLRHLCAKGKESAPRNEMRKQRKETKELALRKLCIVTDRVINEINRDQADNVSAINNV